MYQVAKARVLAGCFAVIAGTVSANDPPTARAGEVEADETYCEFNGRSSLATKFEYTGRHPVVLEAVVEPIDVTSWQCYAGDLQFAGFGLMLTSGGYEFRVHNGRKYVRARAATKPVKGVKVHLAGVYDGRHVEIHVNGKLEDRVLIKRRIKLSKRVVMIGADPAPGGNAESSEHHARARIFEVRILNAAGSPGVKRGTKSILRSRINRPAELLYVDLKPDSLKK